MERPALDRGELLKRGCSQEEADEVIKGIQTLDRGLYQVTFNTHPDLKRFEAGKEFLEGLGSCLL